VNTVDNNKVYDISLQLFRILISHICHLQVTTHQSPHFKDN